VKEIIKEIIKDKNMIVVIIGIVEVLIGAILIKTITTFSTTLLILGGVNIGKRIIWWKGVIYNERKNSICNTK
jgi:hypothetical protein